MESSGKFGTLLYKMRENLRWSRKKLSLKSGLSEAIIESIESGKKANLEIDYLVKLANGLELTSMDRREFFLAAITDLDAKKLVRPHNAQIAKEIPTPTKVRDYLIESIADLRIPAFVSDVYCDILAANKIMVKFLGIPEDLIPPIKNMPVGPNSMRVVFSDISGFRELMNDIWQKSLWMNMRHFRRDSFRYVEEKYYRHVKDELFKIDLFSNYWEDHDRSYEDHFVDLDHVNFFHLDFQVDVHYIITQTTALTEFGELFVISYLPANKDTELLFSKLASDVDDEVVDLMSKLEKPPKSANELKVWRLASWPEKEMPQ